jgi:hypothetical protein
MHTQRPSDANLTPAFTGYAESNCCELNRDLFLDTLTVAMLCTAPYLTHQCRDNNVQHPILHTNVETTNKKVTDQCIVL